MRTRPNPIVQVAVVAACLPVLAMATVALKVSEAVQAALRMEREFLLVGLLFVAVLIGTITSFRLDPKREFDHLKPLCPQDMTREFCDRNGYR